MFDAHRSADPKVVNILGYPQARLSAWLTEGTGEPAYRAKQLLQWIYQRQVTSFAEMSDIKKPLRAWLSQHAIIDCPNIAAYDRADDGTIKFRFDLSADNAIESVYIPEKNRATLCVSSQIGCALACAFCATGQQGFNRNLHRSEIIGQIWRIQQFLIAKQLPKISNVVFMGMGEPLANLPAVIDAVSLLLDDLAYGLSRRRVTVSTAGLVPQITRLAQAAPCALSVSLHAANDTLRNQLVPINKKYPLNQLLEACKHYLRHSPRDFITFEYTLIAGVNDSLTHADELIALVQAIRCKINLIPLNRHDYYAGHAPSRNQQMRFRDHLIKHQLVTTIRKTRGDDRFAACGQLVGQVQDKRAQPVTFTATHAH